MKTEQEILEQFEKLKAPAISEDPKDFQNSTLAKNLIHTLQWVLGNCDEMPPIELLGWVYAKITPEGMEIGAPENIAIPFIKP